MRKLMVYGSMAVAGLLVLGWLLLAGLSGMSAVLSAAGEEQAEWMVLTVVFGVLTLLQLAVLLKQKWAAVLLTVVYVIGMLLAGLVVLGAVISGLDQIEQFPTLLQQMLLAMAAIAVNMILAIPANLILRSHWKRGGKR